MLAFIFLSVLDWLLILTDDSPKLCKIIWYDDGVFITQTNYQYHSYDEAIRSGEEAVVGTDLTVDAICINDREAA